MGTFSYDNLSPASSSSSATMNRTPTSSDVAMADGERELSIRPREALQYLSEESKHLTRIHKEVRSLGIEQYGLPMSKLVVVGAQSTGKSSLIEAMSEIKVPRANDTCTRCPFEYNISEATDAEAPWMCKVYLDKRYSWQPSVKPRAQAMGPSLGPWLQLPVSEANLFCTITVKEDLASALKWAGLATLNPLDDAEQYKPGANDRTEETMSVSFSPNVVRIDITGPGLRHLCFTDLPGVIEQAEKAHDVKLVKRLVLEYINQDNCIILHTMPMNVDVQNLGSGALLDACKGARDRTIGVLTKPDCIGYGSYQQWHDVLSGKKWRLPLGYYVVKNNPDPTTPHQIARAEEDEFFTKTVPFCTELKQYEGNFGTTHLKHFLETLLARHIKNGYPGLISKIKAKLSETADRLSYLPKPIEGNISLEVSRKLKAYAETLENETRGGSFDYDFFSSWRDRAEEFRNMLAGSWPVLDFPAARRTATSQAQLSNNRGHSVTIKSTVEKECVELSDDDEMDATPTHVNARRRNRGDNEVHSLGSPQKKRRLDETSPFEIPEYPSLYKNAVAQKRSKVFTLGEINKLNKAITQGLQGSRDPKVTAKIHQESIKHWRALLKEFLEDTNDHTKSLITRSLRTIFTDWEGTEMGNIIVRTAVKFLDEMSEHQQSTMEDLLDTENEITFTLDTYMKQSDERDVVARLQARSRQYMFDKEMSRQQRVYGDAPIPKNARDAIVKDIEGRPVDFETEIQEMATARAYYNCAARRFADNVPMSVINNLFKKCRTELPEKIAKAIGIDEADANERCKRYLEPQSSQVQERNNLFRQQERLEKAIKMLSTLTNESSEVSL